MKPLCAFLMFGLVLVDSASADTFGSGANTFDIEFVTIGDPGNLSDTTGSPNPAGSVQETYRIGKFEISEQMIDKANALGVLGITKITRGADKPVTHVSWNEAARFVNWLNTSTGNSPAYKFAVQPGEVGYSPTANIELWTVSDAGYDPNNLYRNSLARFFLPGVHEWYKAAYYDPTSGVYYDYPTGSNAAPTPVASGTAAGTAVYAQSSETEPANITLAGGLSPYGTMGQGGNVHEWEETDFDLVNGPTPSSTFRGLRGGQRTNQAAALSSPLRFGGTPDSEGPDVGFRVASILSLPGDYNADGHVDAADYVVWHKTDVAEPGFQLWRTYFGNSLGAGVNSLPSPTATIHPAIPEPASVLISIIGWGTAVTIGRRRGFAPQVL
jgi:sulfatase modifying factor 1